MGEALQEDVGIVLYQKPIFEKDRLICIFCKRLGKISVLAKGALSIRSKKGQILQVFSYVDLLLRASNQFFYVQDCDLIDDFSSIRASYDHIQEASFFVRVVQDCVMQGQRNEALFNWLYTVLEWLHTKKYNETIQENIFMKFLTIEGIAWDTQGSKKPLTKPDFMALVEQYSQRCLRL